MSRLSDNLTANNEEDHARQGDRFSPQQRRILLWIAHEGIVSGVADEPLPDAPPAATASMDWPKMIEPRGVFTTLYLRGQLRGCVGYLAAIRPLYRAVAETARAAAFEDSRFCPVTREEAPELKISLSILSPLHPIRPEQVEVGRHGLVISDGLRRGLLLPQVPVEHGWDRETFLEQTCRKAGLPAGAWRESGELEAFTAEVFGDEGAG